MLIDWFTVGAQTLNFLILVWLLKHFLYRPVLQAIDDREKRVATELAEAAAQKADANQARDELGHQKEEFDRERAALLSRATEEARTERQRLLEAARQEADGARARQEEALRKEQQALGAELTRRTGEEVFAIARQALGDLASASLEGQLTEVLLRRLHALNEAERKGLLEAFKGAAANATVRTAFALSADQQRAVQTAVSELLAVEAPLRFDCAPEMIGGIQLTAGGRKIEWSISDYLAALEKSVGELLPPPVQASTA